ncbi:MAG: exodeoxyribonuclease VII large subunit [Spirochaetaceae bacterium]|jgi:exodeoxyribonuclease VII large subunit|nr:exodeoxyribonuclease VII large subunit [Spirochaetaceae bacterium]
MDEGTTYSVSDLTDRIKGMLEGSFPDIIVEGEASNCRPSSSGHFYFTLKDSKASIQAVMFRNRLSSLSFEPVDGALLRVRGRISVYPPRGNYQLIAEDIEKAGDGDILAMLEKLKRKLAAEGLFDEDRKKPIPRFPQRIGVVSSPTGAAVQDILNVLRRRAAGVHVIVLPALVQGEGAAEAIEARIRQANLWHLADVLIVGRGGGSLEDLLPFSQEGLVRAVAESEIPVISAVGHEIDWALSDFAADLRAPTPSAAAELVSESRVQLKDSIEEIISSMQSGIQGRLEKIRLTLRPFTASEFQYRFNSILQPVLLRFDDAKGELFDSMDEKTKNYRQRLLLAKTALEGASPKAALERGFSVVLNTKTGKPLRSGKDAVAGDKLEIIPLEGKIDAIVEKST